MNRSSVYQIGLDLWPTKRKRLVRKALKAEDGVHVHISIGEAETLARQETEREIKNRQENWNIS